MTELSGFKSPNGEQLKRMLVAGRKVSTDLVARFDGLVARFDGLSVFGGDRSDAWALPWGPAAWVAEATANSAAVGASWTAITPSVTFTQVEGRRYRVSALAVVSASGGTRAYLGIVLWGQSLPVRQVDCYLTTYATGNLVVTYEYNAATTGSVKYTQALYGGAATVTGVGTGLERRQIWVDDIGPWKAKP